jgi:hypothetical protein
LDHKTTVYLRFKVKGQPTGEIEEINMLSFAPLSP